MNFFCVVLCFNSGKQLGDNQTWLCHQHLLLGQDVLWIINSRAPISRSQTHILNNRRSVKGMGNRSDSKTETTGFSDTLGKGKPSTPLMDSARFRLRRSWNDREGGHV